MGEIDGRGGEATAATEAAVATEPALDDAALIGRTLGEFVIRKPLSGGGFGLVFLADQKALRREVVIKVLREGLRTDETLAQRFLREARLASLLDHPYAAHTYGFGAEPDGLLWIAMELVRGTPLDALLRLQGPIPLERFAPLLRRICEVVATAHEQGIVHRDLKPANVMVLSRAGQLLPKLLDFGIAKLTGETEPAAAPSPREEEAGAADPALTIGRVAMGSPHYMAPEQWSDASAADARADIYSLGVICYQSLTGRLPFRAPSREQLASMHGSAPVPPLGDGLPAALDQVIGKAMGKRAAQRYPSALELAAAFEEASGVRTVAAALPRLDSALRTSALVGAPQPLARAIGALEAARNPHEARDGLWQIARVAVRLIASVALAAHRHVAIQAYLSDPAIGEQLRRLRQRAPADAVWLEVARALVQPFAELRDAHPVPELVGYLLGDGSAALGSLVAARVASEERSGGGEKQVRDLLEQTLPIAARAVAGLEFLFDYPLVVATDRAREDEATVDFRPGGVRPRGGAQVWMGVQSSARPQLAVAGAELAPGRAALVDAEGVAVVSLWPFIQLHEPSPGAEPVLFFFDGRGRRGARLVAAPDPFEIEDDACWEALGELLDDSSDAERAAAADEVCPYPGLRAFTEADAAGFFGRERETESFVNRLRVQPLLVVAGPSGAGKSSFVQAGVLPALPASWNPIVVRPGPMPIAGLAARLVAAGLDAADLEKALAADPGALGALLRARSAVTTVLVVDQLEELFTVCDDADQRALYATALARAARSADDPVRVVLTVRDDFLARAEGLPAWRSRLSQGLQILTTPAEPELRRILLEPLQRAGYEMDDPALADEMVASVAGAPAALALLSFTASQLWDLRDRRFRQISRRAYRSLGGVGGALAQHAEATLAAMPSEQQRLVREVFRHAVTAEGTRAILSPGDLQAVLGGGPHAAAVIDKLVAARLLVVSDAELGERIEVAHEMMLDAWPRLVDWRREDAEGARLRDQLRTAARQWDQRERASGLLWRGDALAEYRIWRGRHPGPLTPVEESFASASLADAARARRRLRTAVIAGFVLLAGVAVALLILSARAERQRELAVVSRQAAESSAQELADLVVGQYEAQGRRLLLADDPLQALAFLTKAGERGASGVAHDFLVAQAVSATDGELFSVRHGHLVGQVAFSRDGARLVSVGLDDQARIWDGHDGGEIASLPHQAAVVRLAIAPAGGLIATGSVDGVVALWRLDGSRLHELHASGTVQAIDFAPDGARLVSATSSEEVVVWDAASGAAIARLAPAGEDAMPFGEQCAFSPDGALVAAGTRGGRVRVWNAGSGRVVADMPGHRDRVRVVRFSPDGHRLLSASADGTAAIWQVGRWTRSAALAHRDDIRSAMWSPDSQRLVTASADQTAVVWDAASGRALLSLGGHGAPVNMAAFAPDGRSIATVSDDMTAQLWDAETGVRLARRLGHAGAVGAVAFSPDGDRMATASSDQSAIVWSTEPTRRATLLVGHQGAVLKADVSGDGSRVATAGADGTARIWDRATGRELLILRAHQPFATDVRFSPDGARVATAGADNLIKLWNARSGQPLLTLAGHTGQVQSVAWHPDGDLLASAGEDGALRVWSTRSGRELRAIRGHGGKGIFGVAFSRDGTALISAGDDNVARIWDPASEREIAHHEGRGRYWSVFDPTGERILSTTGMSATIWGRRDGKALAELVGHLGQLQDAQWSDDGRLVVTASFDRTARIWDPASGNLLATYPHPSKVRAARLAAGGRVLVTASLDGTGAVWELPVATGVDLDAILRCRVPYRIDGERIVSRPRDLSACPLARTRR